MDFLIQIHQALQPLHKQLLFWGDIAMNDPELVKTLPKDMIAIAWVYSPEPEGYDKWLLPFTNAGLQTWVAPGVSNWSRVYPDSNSGLLNIQEFVRDGQRLGSTGLLNTVWNDDGEGLFNQDWYGVLFGAAAGWQPGASSIPQFQDSYGQVFHGDQSGKINQAQIELMAAQKTLDDLGIDESSDHLFWMDPWSKEGQEVSAKLLPVVQTLREQAEQAIILMEQAKAAGPLREVDALDAMEMGARRMDFIGFKFEAAQEMLTAYDRAYQQQSDPANNKHLGSGLYDISSNNGRCQDLRDGYGLTRDLYRAGVAERKSSLLAGQCFCAIRAGHAVVDSAGQSFCRGASPVVSNAYAAAARSGRPAADRDGSDRRCESANRRSAITKSSIRSLTDKVVP